jgi:hypothetical protein
MTNIFWCQRNPSGQEHDFIYALKRAVEYHVWLGGSDYCIHQSVFDPVLEEDDVVIPVGTVQFVIKYMRDHNIPVPKPINVPEELIKPDPNIYSSTYFTGRTIINMPEGTSYDGPEAFVKSNDVIKSPINGFYKSFYNEHAHSIQISDKVEILSEWRCFVWRGKLLDGKHYSGDFRIFPDYKKVEEMISVYTEAPCAYTLDVFIDHNLQTYCLEVHDFFSCGLYGFEDNSHLPLMFSGWWKEYIKKVKG